MLNTSELLKEMDKACNYEEKREKYVYCGWCGSREIHLNGKYECISCDEYFINERSSTKFVHEKYFCIS